MEGIKRQIVFGAALVTSCVGGITGLGAQSAFAPMLTWMLGFSAEKAMGEATRFSVYAAIAAVIGSLVMHGVPPFFVWRAIVLLISAVTGALLAAPMANLLQTPNWRRLFQTVGVVFTLVVILQAAHFTPWQSPHIAFWNTSIALFILGLGSGAMTQIMRVVSGALMVPALYFLSGFTGSQAVALSLLVICLASLLPVWGYARQGLIDARYGTATVAGALIGGFGGGLLVTHLNDKTILCGSAVVAMFLCGRELARLTLDAGPTK